MGKYRQRFWSLCLFVLFGLSGLEQGFAQQSPQWRLKNRLQVSYEFDDNIRENPASDSLDRIQDSSLRFLFDSQASRTTSKTRLAFTFRGGLQTYFKNSIENKLINEFDFSGALRIYTFALGVRSSGRMKLYLNDILDYVTGAAELYVQVPLIANVKTEIGVQAAGLNYQNFSIFDYSESQIKWNLSRKLAERLAGLLEFSFRHTRYDRVANFSPGTPNFGLEQQDDHYKVLWQLNYTRQVLINFSYTYQRNNSNTFGYSYSKHQLTLTFGAPLTAGIWLRGYGAYQNKRYREQAIQIFPTDLDTEREESNFFVLDLSKDVNTHFTTLIRLAYYNNESVIRSRFYRKVLLSAGFDFRF